MSVNDSSYENKLNEGLELLIDYNEDKSSVVGNSQEATIFIETLGIKKCYLKGFLLTLLYQHLLI